ncbi:branched-chain amino acid ABC transporter permease [Oryzomicrobium sp.]|uniref:branched-chain amino acid ABC transporter permease n=1 Tax=Oryzomicrobium sp. TaxID=1911578 RepID=UPI0025DF1157|nr:branched-chain amino acid ABC transporter permease [Oryzomicrobium sp.]MCE1243142.1 branched-chain amino acid ABC transporter permease [Oryzomicrobium sp.]
MFYREAGQFKTSYGADQQILPIRQDRIGMVVLLAVAFLGVPMFASEYWFSAILIPFLIFALAALGLNILTGYAGQLSLGSAAFMAVGAYAAYNFQLRIEGIPILVSFLLGGVVAAGVGILFGLPSLRIKGFYLAVATLAAQFFIVWCLTKFPWLSNNSSSGVISAQKIIIFGHEFNSPQDKYLLVLGIVVVLALAAKNLVRGNVGRSWMAVRDMDVAAEVIGFRIMRTKLTAFAVSSFYCGVAGALYAFCYLGSVEPDGFSLELSFKILFMIIIGGVGSILGSFVGAAFILLLPVLLDVLLPALSETLSLPVDGASISHIQTMIFGALIMFFLIVEPHGLARLWQIAKEKLRLWPFPH